MSAELAAQMHRQDFGHAWIVRDGQVVDAPSDIYAPDVYVEEGPEGVWTPDEDIELGEWEFVSAGFTGQHGYRGPIMHASESFGPGMAAALAELAEDYQAFATVAVECIGLDPDEDPEPAGWAVIGLPIPTCPHCAAVGMRHTGDNGCHADPAELRY